MEYVTGGVTLLVAADEESFEKFNAHFEEWNSDNKKFITWSTNTSVPTINHLFKRFGTAKGVWDFLIDHYIAIDLSR